MKNKYVNASLISFVLAAGANAAQADETITLRMAGFVPESHFMIEHGSKVFRDEVTRLTNGKVQWQYYPNQQLGKASEMLKMVQSGIADVVGAAPSYHPDKLPLTSIVELPGMASSACEYSAAMRSVADPGGVIYESEYAPNGLRVLTYEVQEPYTVHSTKPINSIDDFVGLKLRPPGAGMERSISELGGVSVKVPSPEMYEALSRGIVDGVMNTFTSVKAYGLREVSDYAYAGYNFGSGSLFLIISEKKFKKLPKDVQDALVEAGKIAENTFCNYASKLEREHIEMAKEGGVNIHFATAEDKKALDDKLVSVSESWAAQYEQEGKPANQALADYKQAIDEYRKK